MQLNDLRFVVQPRASSSLTVSISDNRFRYSSKISRTPAASWSLTCSLSKRDDNPSTIPGLRCAIYTRKSTEDGLEQEFSSLDAQRDAGEAYIASQKSEGWVCLPDRYDDGGFTGGNMDRPALRRLLDDIEDGKVDCIVVYKVDRLSRSLIDFAKIMDVLERCSVSFVSVTQQFNTSTSMGRLMLNVLLSFAQFEREMISERTRDKIAATRRKGKWSGGMPMLGYDVDCSGGRGGKVRHLAINSTCPDIGTYLQWDRFDTYQIPYSALERQYRSGHQGHVGRADGGDGRRGRRTNRAFWTRHQVPLGSVCLTAVSCRRMLSPPQLGRTVSPHDPAASIEKAVSVEHGRSDEACRTPKIFCL